MKTVKLDIDGVLRNLDTTMLPIYNEMFGEHLTEEDIREYNLEKSYTRLVDVGENVFDFFFVKHANEVLGESEPYENAAKAVELLIQKNYKITIVSYQPTDIAKKATVGWLAKNKIRYNELVFTEKSSKRHVVRDIIVDDCPKYINESLEPTKIVIDRPYNRRTELYSVPHIRFKSLYDFAKCATKSDK